MYLSICFALAGSWFLVFPRAFACVLSWDSFAYVSEESGSLRTTFGVGLFLPHGGCWYHRYDSVFLSIYSRPIYSSEAKIFLVYDSYDRGHISWLPILESSISITYD